MTPGEALELPLARLGQALRSRQVSAAALAEEALSRLERAGRPLNAVAALMPDRARREAAAADRELHAGRWRGPLHGVPYGAKDLLSARGAPTTWGSSLFAGRVIDEDAAAVQKLSAAGAVLIAKLAMVQLAGGFGYHRAAASLQGPGKNPWDPTRWAGGSSTGSAAAVAARCLPFALGSETWGSILTPAALCGVVGLRPTFGRVSRRGAMALAWSMDKIGPICRGAQDALIVLAAISGHDPADPATVEDQPRLKPGRRPARKLRVGLVLPESMQKQDAEIYGALLAVSQAMGKVAEVKRAEIPAPELPSDAIAQLTVSCEEASAFDELIDSGGLAALQSTDAPATARADRQIRAVDYLRAQRVRGRLRVAYAKLFERFDAICTPALGLAAVVAPKLEDDLDAIFSGDDPFGSAGNLLGLPSITLPGPLVRGLPVAMQLVGPPWSEEALCAAASRLEDETPWARQRPGGAGAAPR